LRSFHVAVVKGSEGHESAPWPVPWGLGVGEVRAKLEKLRKRRVWARIVNKMKRESRSAK
jgi:hypothetical protein